MFFISSLHNVQNDVKLAIRACARSHLLVPKGGHIWRQHCSAVLKCQSQYFLASQVHSQYKWLFAGSLERLGLSKKSRNPNNIGGAGGDIIFKIAKQIEI